MSDEAQQDTPPMSPAVIQPPKPKRRMARKQFMRVISLREGTGIDAKRIEVPATAADHQARQQILAAKLQSIIEAQLDLIKDRGASLTPKEYSELANAIKQAGDLGYKSYGGTDGQGAPGMPMSAIGQLVSAGVRAGASMASDDDFQKALGAVDGAARKAKQVIEVSAEEKK